MKRFLILFFCFIIMLNGCNEKKKDSTGIKSTGEEDILTSSIDIAEGDGVIVYGRYGEEREICSVGIGGRSYQVIYKSDFEKPWGYEEKIVFYSRNGDKRGIYLLDADRRKTSILLEGFRLTQRPCFSRNGSMIAFYAYPQYDPKDNEQYRQRLYYMDLKGNDPVRVNTADGEVKHISFIDNDNIVYSKFVKETGRFQIFKYSIKEDIETRLIDSLYNDVNPVASPDGRKIAFLSDRYNNYNLFILNLSTNTVKELDLEDAVVGESVMWSPDGSRIAFVTLSSVAKYDIKLADLNANSIEHVGNGYLATFSSRGKFLVYAAYEINDKGSSEKKQVIYRMNLENKKIEKVWDFPEKSVFSRSINMLYSSDPLL